MGDENKTTSNGNGVAPTKAVKIRQYFDQTKPELDALPLESVKKVALDISEVVMTVSGCQAKIAPFREQIVRDLPTVEMRYFDELERYVGALHHAHVMHGLLAEADVPIAEWSDALAEDHQTLLATAELVAQSGLINGSVLPPLRARTSNKLLCLNVLKLVEVLQMNWPAIENKTVLSLEKLDEIGASSVRLTHAIGERDQRIAALSASTATRQRAYTVTTRAYSEVRRIIGFLRWHQGDADVYAPPLSNARRRPGESDDDAVDEPTDAEVGASKPTANDQTSLGTQPQGAPAQPQGGPNAVPFVR